MGLCVKTEQTTIRVLSLNRIKPVYIVGVGNDTIGWDRISVGCTCCTTSRALLVKDSIIVIIVFVK
jgi:hypothetical protein